MDRTDALSTVPQTQLEARRTAQTDREAEPEEQPIEEGRAARITTKARPRGGGFLLRWSPRHHHDPDNSVVLECQAHCKIPLIRDFAGFTPASDLMRAGNDVAFNFLELGLRLFHLELLVSPRLLKHLLAGLYATKGAARRHCFNIRIK
jgi:hypothetical protein